MDRDTKVLLYLLGYEEGQKEAWNEIKRLIKKYDGWELNSRIQSKLGTLYQDIDFKRAELLDDPSILSVEMEPEERSFEPRECDWEVGSTYLILEEKPFKATEAMRSMLPDSSNALFISQEVPDKLKKTYDLEGLDVTFLELTTTGYNTYAKTNLRCTSANLSSLSSKIGDFIKKNEGSVVLLHSLQDIISKNDFRRTLEFIKYEMDVIRKRNGTLIVSVDGSILKGNELSKLKSYFDEIVEG